MRRKQESIQARMINGSSDLFSIPDDEFTELAWENGQIVMQNQYSKARKETREKVGKFPQQDDDDDDDDDIVPWISYPIEEVLPSETLQDDDYCAEFLNEFSAFDVNPLSTHRSKEEVVRSSNNVEHGHVPKAATWSRIRTSHHPQQFQASAPNSKSTVVDNNAAQELDRRLQKQQQQQQQGSLGTLMNFSHFARPAAALAKAKPHITTISNPSASKDLDKAPGQLELGSAAKNLRGGGGGGGGSVEFSNKISGEDTLRNKKNCSDLPDGLLPSSSLLSSMCSGNINAAASNEPKHGEKRKEYDAEDSDYLSHSEDLQDEYADIRKPPTGRGERAKRGRAAEVHNLSERRRRNRINEKMRALQELIPNCNKVDKASMLEEAIEYLKTLQMQVQIMSMGSRLYMPPPMMFPPTMQHMSGPMVAHFPSVGVGVGAGMGLTPGCPMIPIPPIHAPQFPCTPSSGLSCMNGIPGPIHPSMFGVQGQGFPVLMPRPPQFSTLAGLSLNTNAEPDGHTNNAVGITSDHQSNASTDETQIQVTKDRL